MRFRILVVGGATMTKLAMGSRRASVGTHEQTEEDRKCYRRWARASYVIDFAVFAGLLIGFSLYDRQSARPAQHELTSSIEERDAGKLASHERKLRE
jgi:hypothetical protein